jgi:glycosyltransferase involved in cell wall biosynthesis
MLKNRIMVKFAGSKPNWLIQMIDEFNLKENIDLLGFLNYKEIVAFQKECDLLLITSVKVIDGYDYCIAGKSFDYIKAEKPILGFVTPGAQKKFLLNSGVAIICDPDNIEDSIEKIKNIFNFGINLTPNRDFLENFQRIYLTKKLSSLF